MRPAENIKRLIKNAKVMINPEVKRAALEELVNELEQTKNAQTEKLSVGRIIILHISGREPGFDRLDFDCWSSIFPKALRSDSVAPAGLIPSAFNSPSTKFLLLSILPLHFFTKRLLRVKHS